MAVNVQPNRLEWSVASGEGIKVCVSDVVIKESSVLCRIITGKGPPLARTL